MYFSFSTVFINKEGLIVDLKNKKKKSFLPLMVAGILKAIQEESIGKDLFSEKN